MQTFLTQRTFTSELDLWPTTIGGHGGIPPLDFSTPPRKNYWPPPRNVKFTYPPLNFPVFLPKHTLFFYKNIQNLLRLNILKFSPIWGSNILNILIFSPIPGSWYSYFFPNSRLKYSYFFTALSKLQLIRKFSLVLASQDKFPPREMLLFRFCVHHCGVKSNRLLSCKTELPTESTIS